MGCATAAGPLYVLAVEQQGGCEMLYSVGLQFTFAVCLWTLLDLYRGRGARSQRAAFALLAASCAAWALGEMWLDAARGGGNILLARRLLYLGASILPSAWLLSAARAAGARWATRQPWRAGIGAVPMLLCYALLYVGPDGYFTLRTARPAVHGPLFLGFAAIAWTQIAIGTAYFLQAAVRRHRGGKARIAAIVAGSTLPLLGNLLHLLPQPPTGDFTPVFLGLGGLLIRLSILDSGLASVLPMGRDDVLEQVPTGVLIADLDGTVIDSNRAARALLGAERVEGEAIGSLLSRARGMPGRRIEIETAPLRRAFGNLGRVALLTDRTEAAQLEQQLMQRQKLESLGRLAGGVAHDFNNLLTGILGNAHLALSSVGEEHPASESLKEVIEASELAARLTAQMLAYSGRGQVDVREVDLSREVRAILALLRSSVPKNVQIVLGLRDDLPLVEADPAQVQQVVLNLVMNAAEAIGERQGSIRIASGAQRLGPDALVGMVSGAGMLPGLHAWLEVRDDGCGMDAATRDRMFDPFYSTRLPGRGLGLAAVLGIARAHGGGLRVESQEGRGTTMRLWLPAVAAALEKTPPAATARRLPSSSRLVLVVDDERVVRDVALRALQHAGFGVLAAESGRKAVEMFRARRDDVGLVVLDLTMPDAGGLETFAELRRLEPRLPILLSSGYTDEAVASVCQGDPLAAFLAKPYAPEDLLGCVRDMLPGAEA